MNDLVRAATPQYDLVAEAYARLVAPKYEPIAALVAERVRRWRPWVPQDAVELAAGTGALTRQLAPWVLGAGGRYTATDVSPRMLHAGRPTLDERVELVVADVEDLPFPDRGADLVVCSLGPVQDTDAGWSETARILRGGGRAVLVTWGNDYAERSLIQRVRDRLGLDPLPTSRVEDLLERARSAGFASVDHEDVKLPVVHDSVDDYVRYRAAFGRPAWLGDRPLADVLAAIRAESLRHVDGRGRVLLDWTVTVVEARAR
jgi:SAM-dependent methyltransferase